MHVFITGAGGFIGLALARHFKSLGWQVSGSSHREAGLAELAGVADRAVRLDLFNTPAAALFSGCDAVIHCAYDPAPGSEELNVRGTRGHFSAAAAAGVPYQLFMSSHSARPDAPGEYGRTKYRLEQVFLAAGHAVVRPGLVIGQGGLYAKQRRAILRLPVLLLPAADTAPVFYVALNDLLACIERLVTDSLRGGFNLFVEPWANLREFVEAVGKSQGVKVRILSFPLGPLFLGARLWRLLSLPPSAGIDRMESLRKNLEACPHASDLCSLLPGGTSLSDAIAVSGGSSALKCSSGRLVPGQPGMGLGQRRPD